MLISSTACADQSERNQVSASIASTSPKPLLMKGLETATGVLGIWVGRDYEDRLFGKFSWFRDN